MNSGRRARRWSTEPWVAWHTPRMALRSAVTGLVIRDGRIAAMDVLADPDRLEDVDLTDLEI